MMPPTQVLMILNQTAGASERSPAPPPVWLLPVVALVAAFGWYMHSRWKRGNYFMSRYTTPEREKAKLAVYGPPMLPSAISATACAAILGIWEVWGLPWSGYLFLVLSAVSLAPVAGRSRNGYRRAGAACPLG